MTSLMTRYVIYPEDGCWVAHSLELDIIGCGETPREAVEELKSNADAHLSYARFANTDPFRAAPKKIQNLWQKANESAFKAPTKVRKGVSVRPAGRRVDADVLKWNSRQLSELAARPDFKLQSCH
jgi:predicted RNase H-like HicB family nuclease